MAIAHVRTVDGAADAAGATETINIQVSGTDPVLVVKASTRGSGITVTGVTFNTTEDLVQDITDINNDARASLWYLAGPSVTTADVVVTYSGANRNVASSSVYSGVDQITPIRAGVSNNANGNSALPTVDVAAESGDMIVDVLGQVSAGPDNIGTNSGTLRHNFASTGGGSDTRGAGQEFAATGGTDTMDYGTMTGTDSWAIVAMALREPFTPDGWGPLLGGHRNRLVVE